ncbi:hypothetical protein [Planosporangium mesophilum]|uniref:Uncharacterized protein n=1 Tax=Planosporangium mesophilum TaxID=689768 RepID=A0A8J3WZ56_9ACTN|nr:hypothetical protein [Planosporangium mesophilum]NJC81489.1 hypothetical protein [Planosporangium mesophilum]GII20854.1 hypothetical protein Pme01_04510 [Planosporangium mesophilum]
MFDRQVPRTVVATFAAIALISFVVGSALELRQHTLLADHPYWGNLLSGITGFSFSGFVLATVLRWVIEHDQRRKNANLRVVTYKEIADQSWRILSAVTVEWTRKESVSRLRNEIQLPSIDGLLFMVKESIGHLVDHANRMSEVHHLMKSLIATNNYGRTLIDPRMIKTGGTYPAPVRLIVADVPLILSWVGESVLPTSPGFAQMSGRLAHLLDGDELRDVVDDADFRAVYRPLHNNLSNVNMPVTIVHNARISVTTSGERAVHIEHDSYVTGLFSESGTEMEALETYDRLCDYVESTLNALRARVRTIALLAILAAICEHRTGRNEKVLRRARDLVSVYLDF